MDIHRFINKHHPQEKIFHSNAYARVAQGSSLGSTDSQTFQQRLDVHRNRQEVGHYGQSMIGRAYLSDAARGRTDNPLREPGREAPTQQRFGARGVPRRTTLRPTSRPNFREPPPRGYNPFG